MALSNKEKEERKAALFRNKITNAEFDEIFCRYREGESPKRINFLLGINRRYGYEEKTAVRYIYLLTKYYLDTDERSQIVQRNLQNAGDDAVTNKGGIHRLNPRAKSGAAKKRLLKQNKREYAPGEIERIHHLASSSAYQWPSGANKGRPNRKSIASIINREWWTCLLRHGIEVRSSDSIGYALKLKP